MNRTKINSIIDTVAFVESVFLCGTGVLLRYVLPPGSGHFQTLWGLDRHEWGQLHFWNAVIVLATLGIHLFLHWRWIVYIVKGRSREGSGSRFILGFLGLIALLGLVLSPFFSTVENKTGQQPHRMRSEIQLDEPDYYRVDGSMTLLEVEKFTGVSYKIIISELGLPSDVSGSERLGRLRRQYGFEMSEVHDAIGKNKKQK
ncbi:MAG: DUF4405 domain-containing protein [Calditrichaeota bacterium]|nr:DUF4405 domain-containing protein [Calditrichota bacterium]